MRQVRQASPGEGGEETEVYLRLHELHVEVMMKRAARLLRDAHDSEERAGVLHELLQELYRHEDRLQRFKEEGLVGGYLQRQPSLVPVNTFLRAYLADPVPALTHSCRALQPFAARAASCPIFSYVVERLGLLGEPPPEVAQDQLALRLRSIHAIFGGPPGVEAGPLGAHHAHLTQRFAECLARRWHRVRLEACEPLCLTSRVMQWLEDAYRTALKDLGHERLALSVLREAHAALLATPYPLKDYLHHVVAAAMDCFTSALAQLPPAPQPTPALPPQPPEPLMAGEEHFFPGRFLNVCAKRVFTQAEALPVLLRKYLKLVSVVVRVCGEPPEHVSPRTHVSTLVSSLRGQDDITLLKCLHVVLPFLKSNVEPGAVREVCLTLRGEAINGLREAWARQVPAEPLHENQPILRVTGFVHGIALLSDPHPSPFPDEAVQETWEQVYAAFLTYLRRVAATHQDTDRRSFILLKNLLEVGTYDEAKQHLDLHASPHATSSPPTLLPGD